MSETTRPALTACSYNLFHAPWLAMEYGTTPETERRANPDSAFLAALEASLRGFDRAVAYPPNQAFIGNLDPRQMPPRPWHNATAGGAGGAGSPAGPFGAILDEARLYGLVRFADVFDLVALEKDFSAAALAALRDDPVTRDADLSRFGPGVEADALEAAIASGALPLKTGGRTVGCVKAAHPSDIALSAHTMLENLCSKATAVYALRRLLAGAGGGSAGSGSGSVDPASVDYIIETSEEACGDMNQRGGGNFAKAIGELCGLVRATGSDVRSFCAGPVHGLIQAASHVAAGTFGRVIVVAGGTSAKLAMNAKKHIEKGLPVLEDCMGSFAFLVERDRGRGLILRNDIVGMHRIGSGSSPQAVIRDLVVEPAEKAGITLSEIEYYAPELQNPEITEAAGAGNVTLSNVKMIAAMAVMRKEIPREGIDAFIARHGLTGWAPTQGHIPSGVPALGWFLLWAARGELTRALVIGKGSLFLGRMTNLFDGVSILVDAAGEANQPAARVAEETHPIPAPASARDRAETVAVVRADTTARHRAVSTSPSLRLGLTIPGSESGPAGLVEAAREARSRDSDLEVVLFGEKHGDPDLAHREMEKAIADGAVQGALTFHYPFPIGSATIGMVRAPGTGRELFIAATTGTMSVDRVEALVRNAIGGLAVAKAYGINRPRLGLLNLDGAAVAHKILRELAARGYETGLTVSGRGDSLLRGNDILAGTVDVLVCDSLTGNALMKVLAAYPAAGKLEVLGSGYGPCVGAARIPVGIISRASSASVVTEALVYLARSLRGDVFGKYRHEVQKAEEAGLVAVLEACLRRSDTGFGTRMKGDHGVEGAKGSAHTEVVRPAKMPVSSEIGGIDVLEIENAVSHLMAAGIYCEAGMGCTGPVVMVSKEDADRAKVLLAKERLL